MQIVANSQEWGEGGAAVTSSCSSGRAFPRSRSRCRSEADGPPTQRRHQPSHHQPLNRANLLPSHALLLHEVRLDSPYIIRPAIGGCLADLGHLLNTLQFRRVVTFQRLERSSLKPFSSK